MGNVFSNFVFIMSFIESDIVILGVEYIRALRNKLQEYVSPFGEVNLSPPPSTVNQLDCLTYLALSPCVSYVSLISFMTTLYCGC